MQTTRGAYFRQGYPGFHQLDGGGTLGCCFGLTITLPFPSQPPIFEPAALIR